MLVIENEFILSYLQGYLGCQLSVKDINLNGDLEFLGG